MGVRISSALADCGRSSLFLQSLISGKFELQNKRLGIRPWGFVDKDLEASYRTYFTATFVQNHRTFLLCFFGFVSTVHLPGLVSMLVNWQDAPRRALALTVLRNGFNLCILWMLSQKHVLSFTKWLFRLILFSPLTVMRYGILTELCNPHASVEHLQALIFVSNVLFLPMCSLGWRHSTFSTLMICLTPVLFHAWSSTSGFSATDVVALAVLSTMVGALSLLVNADLQVRRRRQWLASSRPRDKRRSEPTSPRSSASRSASRSASPISQARAGASSFARRSLGGNCSPPPRGGFERAPSTESNRSASSFSRTHATAAGFAWAADSGGGGFGRTASTESNRSASSFLRAHATAAGFSWGGGSGGGGFGRTASTESDASNCSATSPSWPLPFDLPDHAVSPLRPRSPLAAAMRARGGGSPLGSRPLNGWREVTEGEGATGESEGKNSEAAETSER